MSKIKASMVATLQADGETVECWVRCDGREAKITFAPDDIVVDVPEHQDKRPE